MTTKPQKVQTLRLLVDQKFYFRTLEPRLAREGVTVEAWATKALDAWIEKHKANSKQTPVKTSVVKAVPYHPPSDGVSGISISASMDDKRFRGEFLDACLNRFGDFVSGRNTALKEAILDAEGLGQKVESAVAEAVNSKKVPVAAE